MPRGVPANGQRRKPSPKAVSAKPVKVKAAPPKAPAAEQPIEAVQRGPVRSVDIDSLQGEALRTYARRIGVSGRDCNELGEDRLRQNCKLFLNQHFQELSA